MTPERIAQLRERCDYAEKITNKACATMLTCEDYADLRALLAAHAREKRLREFAEKVVRGDYGPYIDRILESHAAQALEFKESDDAPNN